MTTPPTGSTSSIWSRAASIDPAKLLGSIRQRIDKYIREPHLHELVMRILDEHEDLFSKMPAAQNMHHSYTAGLLEHVWSMTQVAESLIRHYGDEYYVELDPPLDKGVVIAAIVLHDIGKLRELRISSRRGAATPRKAV